MDVWFLVVTFMSGDAKLSPFETEAQCKAAMPVAVKQFKKDTNVVSVSCLAGEIVNEGKEKAPPDVDV